MRIALNHRGAAGVLSGAVAISALLAGPSWSATGTAARTSHAAPAAHAAQTRHHRRKKHKKRAPSILSSPLLWSTVDICGPRDQPDTVGVRGSMPGDGRGGEFMFMRFRFQYRDPSTGRFQYVAGADSGYVLVGPATTHSLQAGRSFQFLLSLQPPPYRPRYVLRGWVDFQWRHKHKVVRSAARPTTAPHETGSAGDPRGYSAAGCVLG